MQKKLILLTLIVFTVVALGGCSIFGSKPVSAGPITLVDDFDREIQLDGPAQVIISLVPASTEILYALGVGDRLVGASDFCDYPAEAKEIQRVGGFDVPNLELIVSLEPDLVLAASLHKDTVEALETLDIAVLALDPHSIEEIYANIEVIAIAAGKEQEGEALIGDMQTRLADISQKMSGISDSDRPVVYYEVWYPGPMTSGAGTFIDEMINIAGGENIAHDTAGWVTLQEEELLERNPEVIVHGHYGVESSDFAQRDGWNVLAAIANSNIHFINPDIINRTGPRVVDAIEAMARIFHPDKFE